MDRRFVVCLTTLLMVAGARANPKKYDPTGGFQPSSGNVYQQTGDQVAMESVESNKSVEQRSSDDNSAADSKSAQERPKEPKFGFAFPGVGLQPSGSSGVYPGHSGQINLDIGGLILGAVVGLGAVFILPKIIHLFSGHTAGHHGGDYHYKRSEPSESTIMQLLSKVDSTLAQYNVDSASCVQRAICSYVKTSSSKVKEGKANNFDALIDIASSNSIMSFMLDGSSIKKAVDKGKSGENCGYAYPKCPFNKDSVFAAVKGLLGDQLLKER